jgi:hypothetical protein
MIAEKAKKSNIGIGVGILVEIAGRLLLVSGATPLLGIAVLVSGIGLMIWGCFNYAEAKGYPQVVGLLGLCSILGLIVLVLLPDKLPNGIAPGTGPGGPTYGNGQDGTWPPPPNPPA